MKPTAAIVAACTVVLVSAWWVAGRTHDDAANRIHSRRRQPGRYVR
jgi:hypothetical protein